MMMFILCVIAFFLSCPASLTSKLPLDSNYPIAKHSTWWINGVNSLNFTYGSSIIKPIFLRIMKAEEMYSPRAYACGFYCNGTCDSYLFAIYIFTTYTEYDDINGSPQIVWSANGNNPVGENATLELANGELVLRDADGTFIWSTGTSGKAAVGLNLTEMGNLILFDANKTEVWQSFDHPTDCLLPGQILGSGENLTSGLYSLSMTETGLVASIQSDPPQIYYPLFFVQGNNNKQEHYARFFNGSLDVHKNGVQSFNMSIATMPFQYMRLGHDGHVRVFEKDDMMGWMEVADIFNIDKRDYPMVCGKHGIYSSTGQCSCPGSGSDSRRFRLINERKPELGCSEVIPFSCNASSDSHSFFDLENITYFTFVSHIRNTDINSCKEACLKNCTCKAAIMRYSYYTSDCYMPSEVFSLVNVDDEVQFYRYYVSLKVQDVEQKASLLWPALGSSLGAFCVFVVIGGTSFVLWRRRNSREVEEEFLDHVPGMPTRFSFQELVIATENFSKKLGQGGFGTVFEGLLKDDNGTRVAVKCLDGVGHVKKSFLAEVETIGSIHHINLVRLVGFCAEKSHRLLVYEYMCNGSLDRWIFHSSQNKNLDWNCRRKIIFNIAKGLVYLHEECRQKIFHLDIKPQNILLDEHYNAKVADFGLSKLIDRNQSRVVTTMRGTPGYLAPEWLSAVITEKVDVYSFGVVVLEIVCGRRIFEQSMPEEERYLLPIFMKSAEDGKWGDLVDKYCHDVECCNEAQVEEMMQISAWCMQSDHEKRPRMSTVIKVLEGFMDVQTCMNYETLMPQLMISKVQECNPKDATAWLPSILSGPR